MVSYPMRGVASLVAPLPPAFSVSLYCHTEGMLNVDLGGDKGLPNISQGLLKTTQGPDADAECLLLEDI